MRRRNVSFSVLEDLIIINMFRIYSDGDTMPRYSIKNQDTNEVFEVDMKFAELAPYLSEHPTYKQVFTRFPGTADPMRLGRTKPDNGFRDVLKEVSSAHKRNIINTW